MKGTTNSRHVKGWPNLQARQKHDNTIFWSGVQDDPSSIKIQGNKGY